jgi:hypothetical protein
MDRPLWQLLAMIFVLGLVLRRAAFVFAFDQAGDGGTTPLALGYAVQLAAGLLAGLFVAIEHRFVRPALVVLGASLVATLGLEAASPGGITRFEAVSGGLALALTAALYVFLRRHAETGEDAG